MSMDFRIVLLLIAAASCENANPKYYSTGFTPESDLKGETTNQNLGFVEPLDFAAITQQFLGSSHSALSVPFSFGAELFGAESKDDFKNLAPFHGSLFAEETKQNSTGFVHPVRFVSPFDGQRASTEVIYRPQAIYKQLQENGPPHRSVDTPRDEAEDSGHKPLNKPKNLYKHSKKVGPQEYGGGKGSYSSPVPQSSYKSEQSLYPGKDEVEVFYPKGKAILPTINGRPKPYDGYRAATEEELQQYDGFRQLNSRANQRDAVGRYSEGNAQIIYGRPGPSVVQPYVIRKRRSQGYDHRQQNKEETKAKEESQGDNQGHATEEEKEEEEYSEEPDAQKEAEDFSEKFDKFRYENNFDIPELKVKSYPFEKIVKGGKRPSKRENSDDGDEFTLGYLSFKESLPSDLEKFYGSSEIDEKYTVAATENLEQNKDCERVKKQVTEEEIKQGKAKRDVSEQQVCYVCKDPKTGGSYEQCAYQSDPQNKKYFYGGSTSFSSKQEPEPKSYRYRRSLGSIDTPFNYEYYFFDEPTGKRVIRQQPEFELHTFEPNKGKPTQNLKKKRKTRKYSKLQKEPSGAANKESSRQEEPPPSYNGPLYTYEGPKNPYEGPADPYEGPSSPYEGPSEPYEGPNQEYYDVHDERIGDYQYEAPKSLQYQSAAPSKTQYHSEKKPNKPSQRSKPTNYNSNYQGRSLRGPKSQVEEFPGGQFKAGTGYIANYRFGPEHFEEYRIPQEESAASNEKEDTELFTGNVKIYKNGDVCEKKKKDNMICMECKNQKSGGTYEQCQYSSKPKDKYYKFGRAKSYTSGGPKSERQQRNVDSDQFPEKSDHIEKKILITKTEVFGDDASPEELELAETRNYGRLHEFLRTGDLMGSYSQNVEKRDTSDEDSRNGTETEARNTDSVEQIEPRDGVPGLDEYLYGGPESESEKDGQESDSYKSYDEYFRHLFPEFAKVEAEAEQYGFDPFEDLKKFREGQPELTHEYDANEESGSETQDSNVQPQRLKDQPSRIPKEFYYDDEDHKKNLEKALGEFQQKDWSKCKKIEKNKLTCYQCVDKNGINNEECMYVEESQPVQKHLAYHEKKDFKPNVVVKTEAETQNKEQVVPLNETQGTDNEQLLRRTRRPKNARQDVINVTEAPQETVNQETFLKGDLEGVEKAPAEEVTTTTTESIIEEENTAPKQKVKKMRKFQKKRNKTAEGTTEGGSTEKPRKRRKHPVKKYNREQDSLGDETSRNGTEAGQGTDESVVMVFFNSTETTPS